MVIKTENKCVALQKIRFCSFIGGNGIIVSAIAEPDISLNVVPVAR